MEVLKCYLQKFYMAIQFACCEKPLLFKVVYSLKLLYRTSKISM